VVKALAGIDAAGNFLHDFQQKFAVRFLGGAVT
jgi:hypothetical protein